MKPRILILYTGGTIGMIEDAATKSLRPFDFNHLIDNVPKMMRRSKLPIVKAKVGPKVMSLIADEAVYDLIPLKKEVKATVSGIYITKVTGVRGPLEKPQGKKSFRARMQEKAKKANAELEREKAELAKEKAAKKKKK